MSNLDNVSSNDFFWQKLELISAIQYGPYFLFFQFLTGLINLTPVEIVLNKVRKLC